ncbi:ABC transporter permease [Citricoccus nitrophenolicus]
MTTATLHPPTARRPGPKSWLALVGAEAKMVTRDTSGLIIPLSLPLLILVMSAAPASQEVIVNGRTALDLFVLPLVLTVIIATIGIINMPSFLAYYRRSGILRRLAVTPASPAMVLVAQAVVSLLQAVLGLALALAVAFWGFGANPPAHLWAGVGIFLLALAAMYALGMMVAAVAPTPNSAVAIGLVLFFAFGALGGLFGGVQMLPDALAPLADWLPFGAAVQSLGSAWAGVAVEMTHLVSLATTTVIGTGVAIWLFRWE